MNFNDLPSWQKRGVGLSWERYLKSAENPKTGEPTTAERRRIAVDLELPMGQAYEDLVRRLVLEELDLGEEARSASAGRGKSPDPSSAEAATEEGLRMCRGTRGR